MLIIASSLAFTGGTTFLVRLSKYCLSQGEKLGVLVLENDADPCLLKDLENHAQVFYLENYLRGPFVLCKKVRFLSVFLPVENERLKKLFDSYGSVHVMGLIGLMFVINKLKDLSLDLKVTTAVYHQNEYMFTGVNAYFVEKILEVFLQIKQKNILFFNNENKKSYTEFFRKDFTESLVVPIGVEIPENKKKNDRPVSFKIISIGNLYAFKTYNLHMIDILPELLEINPSLTYEIYGEGPLDKVIKSKVIKLGLSEHVILRKQFDYQDFNKVAEGAALFVGSGSALIEAAALGVPALIGIESSESPETYGFIADIDGFSYNEKKIKIPLYLMKEKIEEIIQDKKHWQDVSLQCRNKAETFSISHTYAGFKEAENKGGSLSSKNEIIKTIDPKRMFLSFIFAAVKDVLGVDRTFSLRRNQGSIL